MDRRTFVRVTSAAAAGAAALQAAGTWADAIAETGAPGAPPTRTGGGPAMAYEVKAHLKPSNLKGLSENQIAQHWKLYEGYVAQSNALRAELEALRKEGKGATPLYADRRRRFGFEYNGMVLHEYYFGNLKAGVAEPGDASPLRKALSEQFGSFEAWKDDCVKCGATRGIGWAALYLDPATGWLTNHFIQLHEDGNVAGFVPILVLDVFEHAYMVDFPATGRPDYMKAFFENVNWEAVEKRFAEASAGKIPARF
ncbi:MAG: Fe-Mn family superoxide dismutase [Acidobacteriota bacterium]